MKNLLLERFGLTQEGSTCEKFLAIRQEGTVWDYRCLFEALSSPLTGLSEDVLESTFINGLRLDTRSEVRMMKPSGLPRIMEFAQRVEDRNGSLRPNKPRSGTPRFRTHGFSGGSWHSRSGPVMGYNPPSVGSGYSSPSPPPSSPYGPGLTTQFSPSSYYPQLPSFQCGQAVAFYGFRKKY